MYQVYTLIDPRDMLIHYVGISCNVEQRYHAHLTTDRHNASKVKWIRELESNHLTPILSIIETRLTLVEAKQKELDWIQYHLEQGMPLVNISGVNKPWIGGIRQKRPKPDPQPPTLLLVREVAEIFGVTTDTVRRWLRNCDIPAYVVESRWMVAVSEIDKLEKVQRSAKKKGA